VIKLNRYRIIFAFVLVILFSVVLISACNNYLGIGGTGESPSSRPATPGILAPVKDTDDLVPKVLVGSPVQIQSAHQGNISRVELRIQAEGDEVETLMRADAPEKGVVLQEWVPDRSGLFTVEVVAYAAGSTQNSYTIQVEVTDSLAVSVAPVQNEVADVSGQGAEQDDEPQPPTGAPRPAETPRPAEPSGQEEGTIFEPPTVTPEVVVVMNATPQAAVITPTTIPRYPPPPPIPGVPYGPRQEDLPDLMPPVCDAAEFLDVFAANTSQRITVTEPNDIAAKTVGGATIHRAWRLRNTGTCTWGPGYELAFYGGRSMGSGGVAFEASYPNEPGRRNIIVDNARLIVPEGKPNQVAIVEVLLNVPVTPGIHQSYWRMRNPQGVYFGPIIGVTLEVVRECEFGIYGAPVINKFEILGVGNVFMPNNPVEVLAEFGDTVTLDWDVINTTNFDIILTDPTGDVSSLSNVDTHGRVQFRVTELGEYIVTIYADNGPCTVSTDVTITVVPPEEDLFDLELILAPSSAAATSDEAVRSSSVISTGDVGIEWRHFDENVDDLTLIAQLYMREFKLRCPLVDSIFGWRGHCSKAWGSPVAVAGKRVVKKVGDSGDAKGAATITNVEQILCPDPTSYDPTEEGFGIQYIMQAQKEGLAAKPKFSNTVDVPCATSSPGSLPQEILPMDFGPDG
jgi:hypothetical protein